MVEPTHNLKNMLVKLDHFPNFRGDHLKKILEPPPSLASMRQETGTRQEDCHIVDTTAGVFHQLAMLC